MSGDIIFRKKFIYIYISKTKNDTPNQYQSFVLFIFPLSVRSVLSNYCCSTLTNKTEHFQLYIVYKKVKFE